MKIVHIMHSYYPKIGGMERAVQFLAEEQVKTGHEVHVVTSLVKEGLKEEIINGVHVHRIKAIKFYYPDLTYPLEYPRLLPSSVDIVHAHSHNSLFSVILAKKLKEKLKAKVVFYFMAVEALNDHPSRIIRLLAPHYSRWAAKKALNTTNLILVKSLRDKKLLREIYGVEAEYLPDGVPEYYFTTPRKHPEEFREKFNIKQEKMFLFIGRMHRLKGPHILVQALQYLDREIAAVFIGPNECRREVLNLAEKLGVKDRIHLLGYVDEETKIHAIDSAEALILPSIANYAEVYPIVISEAWAREKPVIASSIGEIPYRVKNNINGLLVEPGSARSLAEAMYRIVNDKQLSIEMGKNGKKEVLTWREICTRSIEIYKHLINE